MKKNQFTNFDYEIITSSSTGKKEVKVSYEFDGKQCRKYLPIDEKASLKDSECIEAAKAQIEADIKNGQLAKYSKKFTFSVHFGIVPTVVASIAGVAAITCASLFAWKAITGGGTGGGGGDPTGETVVVDFLKEDGTLLERKKVAKGDKVTKPEDPETEDDGYFANWYTESTFEHIYNFDAGVENDLTLYPKFTKHLLTLNYYYAQAVIAGFETPTIELAINDTNLKEEVLINWGDSEELIPITDFSQHITHTYTEAPAEGNVYYINIYGKPDSVSLSSVKDETKPWETRLFRDDNAFTPIIELYQDFGDPTKSSSFGGLDSHDEKAPVEAAIIHGGVTHIPNHFFASTKFAMNRALIERTFFPSSVIDIGDYAYANTNLSQALIRDSVRRIGKGAFQNCTNIDYIRFGRYIKSIEDYAFYGTNNPEIYFNEMYDEYYRSKIVPTAGTNSFPQTFEKIYFAAGGIDFINNLKNVGKWPIGEMQVTCFQCLPMTYSTLPVCLHSYKVANDRYPVLITGTKPSCPKGNYCADVECIDEPNLDVNENNLSFQTVCESDSEFSAQWTPSTMGEPDLLSINDYDISKCQYLYGYRVMFGPEK